MVSREKDDFKFLHAPQYPAVSKTAIGLPLVAAAALASERDVIQLISAKSFAVTTARKRARITQSARMDLEVIYDGRGMVGGRTWRRVWEGLKGKVRWRMSWGDDRGPLLRPQWMVREAGFAVVNQLARGVGVNAVDFHVGSRK